MAFIFQGRKLDSLICSLLAFLGLFFLGVSNLGAFPEAGVPDILQKLAATYTEKGFKLRKEHWRGKLKGGEQKVVKHQLFRGNEYWFWAAVLDQGRSVNVEIFDESGNAVSLEKFSANGTSGARVLPVKTATYMVQITVEEQGNKAAAGEGMDWALVYGYR